MNTILSYLNLILAGVLQVTKYFLRLLNTSRTWTWQPPYIHPAFIKYKIQVTSMSVIILLILKFILRCKQILEKNSMCNKRRGSYLTTSHKFPKNIQIKPRDTKESCFLHPPPWRYKRLAEIQHQNWLLVLQEPQSQGASVWQCMRQW